jgi:hypothetical protein
MDDRKYASQYRSNYELSWKLTLGSRRWEAETSLSPPKR